MQKIVGSIFGISDVKFRTDDDFIDRLNRRYTVLILVIFSVLVTTKIYVGEPIHCWCPAQFTDTHKSYANTICWVKNTYYLPWGEDIPKTHEPKIHISYYQWVPMILVAEAFMFYLPSIVWRFLCRRSGLNISAIIDAGQASQKTSYSDIHDKTVRYMVKTLDKYLMVRYDYNNRNACSRFKAKCAEICCLFFGKFYGNFLMLCYLFSKLLYAGNAVAQLYVLDVFLGSNFHMYGIEVINKFLEEDDWTFSERFPRVTLCDFKIRHQNQLQPWVVQCVLPINLFNEKIFIFVWFWIALLAIVSLLSFLNWLWKSVYYPYNVSEIKTHLKGMTSISGHRQNQVVKEFVTKYLRRDGLFVLRLISHNVGTIVGAEVVTGLWEIFQNERRQFIGKRGSNRRPDKDGLVNNRGREMAEDV